MRTIAASRENAYGVGSPVNNVASANTFISNSYVRKPKKESRFSVVLYKTIITTKGSLVQLPRALGSSPRERSAARNREGSADKSKASG